MPSGEPIETRRIVTRTDGMSLTVTRGNAVVMPLAVAVLALEGEGLALWLAGMPWRPPRGKPHLRLVRLIQARDGTWDEARSAFLAR